MHCMVLGLVSSQSVDDCRPFSILAIFYLLTSFLVLEGE